MVYKPSAAGGSYAPSGAAKGSTGNPFAGTVNTATSSTAQLGLPGQWATARVVTAAKPTQKQADFLGPGRDTTPAGWTPELSALAQQDMTIDPNIKTIDQLLVELNQLTDPQAISNVQQTLWQGNFYGKTKKGTLPFETGKLDDSTRRAFAKAAHEAATQKVMFGDYITAKVDEAQQAGLGAFKAAPAAKHIVIHHASTSDLEAAALSGYQQATGHGPTDAESARFLAAFRATETGAREDALGAGTQTVTDAGNPTNAAAAQARTENPGQAQSMDRLSAFQTVLSALGVR